MSRFTEADLTYMRAELDKELAGQTVSRSRTTYGPDGYGGLTVVSIVVVTIPGAVVPLGRGIAIQTKSGVVVEADYLVKLPAFADVNVSDALSDGVRSFLVLEVRKRSQLNAPAEYYHSEMARIAVCKEVT